MSRNVELESAIKYTISNPTRYNGFLRVAANNFRLSTANQLFVYYQKEDADIVLDAGRWEKLFGRIVADNAQKIRIVQTGKTGKPQWTTYYDIADTIVTDDSKPVMRATVAQDVSMEQIREIAEKKMLLASSQIEDYMAANGIIAPAERIIGFIKDSIISEVAIKCGQEPLLYYEQINDFRKWALKDERIFKVFSAFFHNISNEMVNELSATQQRENDIETERTGGNRSDNTRGIEGEGSSAGTDGERRRGIAGINHRTEIISGKVREAEAGILGESEPSTNNDLGRVPVGADSISESSSAASVTNEAADDETAHHEKGDNGGIETSESDVVGSKNDNGAERSGGSNSPRSDLHRIEQTIELADYSDEEQDELLNQVLCASKDLKYKIYFTYERQLRDEKMSAADFAKFIANAYGTGGAYPFTKYKGQDINLAYDLSKGLQLRAGFKDKGLSYTWRVVGRRIRHLIEDNRYLTEDEKTGYLEYIHNEEIRTRRAAIGKDLLSLVRKYNEETENKETWVNTYELTFVLNAYEGREISFGSKSVRKSLDSVLDTITNFGGEKYLPAVDGIKNRLIIEDNAEKQEKKNWIYSAADLAEPKVTILWSESEELQDGQVMSLYEANSTFERLDGEKHEAQGYDKTKFKINYVLDGEVGSYEGRYDIGDGDGSLIDHISTYQTDFLDNEKWDAYIKERDGEEALAADKKQRKQLVYKFIPYLNLHVALSEIEAQANKRLERSANLSDGINAYYDALLEYVVNSRASINNGNFDLPKVPHITDYDEELIAYAKQVNDAVIAEANSDVNDTAIIDNEEHTIPHHQYTDGETVYIGAEEYVITSISDNFVVVAQANAPLFTTTYNKEEFEQKLLENPLNSKYLCETDTLSLAAADEPDADVDLDSNDVEEAKEVSESKTITDDFAEYENVKRDYPESYVLYQVGDFYEAYREDAQEIAQMLDLRVTNHLVHDDLRVSMCGFPVYALERYLPTIQQHEKSVAVCSRDSNGLIVNAKQKEKMFERVNNGEIRVIMGSTSKMGAGTNIQKKLYALFHLDCPWRPSDLEQQEGRIERQGNGNDTVKIFTCITEGTFDGYMYQLIEAKQRVAAQIMTSKSPAREVEEDDVMTLNYAELKALTMENPVFKEKMDLEIAISRLKMQKSNYLSNKYRMEDKLAKEFPRLISETKTGIENLTKDAATYVKNERAEFTITINGVVYTDRVEGGKAMTAYAGRMLGRKIGEYHGFDLYASMKAEWLQVMVKGATAYWFELGPDAGGNIQRLNNLIKSYPERLLTAKKDLENLYAEQKTVSETVKKPFFHETELKQKLARLAEIDNQIAQSEKEKSEDTAKGVIKDEQEKKFSVEDYCRKYATGEITPEYEAESSM